MKGDILATAIALTGLISFAVPAKAENPHTEATAHLPQEIVASSYLNQTGNIAINNSDTELKFVAYDPYPFGTVEGVVILSHKHGIGCLVGDRNHQVPHGAVMCGLIDNE